MSSRIVVHDLANRSVGEFRGILNRGWTVIGVPGVEAGGSTSVAMSDEIASQPWMQLGRVVTAYHPTLPTWAGVIDSPWSATLPVRAAVYNIEYLFALRTPDTSILLKGSTGDIVDWMLQDINTQEETYLRLGVVDDDVVRQETLDTRPYWDQIKALLERAGMEMQIRPVKQEGRLYLYVDVLNRVGRDTGFLFHDGDNPTMSVLSASLDGEIWNRVIGIGDESTKAGRKVTAPMLEPESRDTYRLRSRNVQYKVTEQSTLDRYTAAYVQAMSQPVLKLKVTVNDVEQAFANVAVGNTGIFHAHNVHLPGGRIGWKGTGRMTAIAYDESKNTVGMLVEGYLQDD